MANFGETLRRERELRDISLREIADATKVNLRYLQALEQNRFDILPGGVFNKGFIRAYARFIGADGEAFVDRYLQEIAEREVLAQGAAATTPGLHPAPGLHRPPEAPRRRATPEPAPPVASPAEPGATPALAAPEPPTPAPSPAPRAPAPITTPAAAAAPPWMATFAEAAARPTTTLADHRLHLGDVPSSNDPRVRLRVRATTAMLWLAGAAGIALLGVWVVRGLRPAVPEPTLTATVPAGEDDASPAEGSDAAGAPAEETLPEGVDGATGGAPGGPADGGTGAPVGAEATAPSANLAPASGYAPTGSTPAAGATPPGSTPSTTSAPSGGAWPPTATSAPVHREPEPTRRDEILDMIASPGGAPRQGTASQPNAAQAQTGTPRTGGTTNPTGAGTRAAGTQAAGTQAAAPRQVTPPSQAPAPQYPPVTASVTPPPAGQTRATPGPPVPSGPMEFRIEATAPVGVQVACDGDERLNQSMLPGQGFSMRCWSFVRVSVTDAGAVRLTVNGGRCATPGGTRMHGFVIRADDAAAICPIPQGATHGRR